MVNVIRSDLDFILKQIIIAEQHAAGTPLTDLIPNGELGWGLRTVDGTFNNLYPGQENFGAADQPMPRAVDPVYINEGDDAMSFGPGATLTNNDYGVIAPNNAALPPRSLQPGDVVDADPRTISNLIADQSANNPAAVLASGGTVQLNGGLVSVTGSGTTEMTPGIDGLFNGIGDTPVQLIPNVAADDGLSAPFNGWMTLFGQFFDHGLDLIAKGGQGSVYIPLQPDDPLYVPGGRTNFMVLTRATTGEVTYTRPDGSTYTVQEAKNLTTPFVDQNQTYTSHPSMQVFHREYVLDGAGRPVATGRLLDHAGVGGPATWAEVKAQALSLFGIELDDQDVLNGPMIATDPYGNFIPGANGFPQIATADGLLEGNPAAPIDASLALRTGHAFLDDIANAANPAGKTADTDDVVNAPGTLAPGQYDDELLDAHYVTGDGRGNENIGLTAVHHVFHSEHNRQVAEIKKTILLQEDAFVAEWVKPVALTGVAADDAAAIQAAVDALRANPDDAALWNGERLFQAAKFPTEMQYQHLVFEEFARTVQPNVNVFVDYNGALNPAILAEFAHTVYRFGHSMLNETVDRYDANWNVIGDPATPENQMGLIAAFLNPVAFEAMGTADEAAGALVRGMTRQVGNEIDEFVTDSLRNNLLGIPLDLAALNIARGREQGVPTLNAARRDFYENTQDSFLKPYTNWVEFAANLKNPLSVVNFIAAYGTHASILAATTTEAKRNAATDLVFGSTDPIYADRIAFLNGTGAWANQANGVTITGVDAIDFWIGGLAEKKMPFGGMLGSTFNFVFETQLEALQDGDRFYYLSRLAGLNLTTELENNTFSQIIARNTNAEHLSGNVFVTPGLFLEADQTKQFNAGLGSADPTVGDPSVDPNALPDILTSMTGNTSTLAPGVQQVVFRSTVVTAGLDGLMGTTDDVTSFSIKYTGGEHIVMGGTAGNDTLIGSDGDDTYWGDEGDDVIEGGAGIDLIFGGDGNDIITDSGDVDIIRAGAGDDVINPGSGIGDLVIGYDGNDFVIGGEDDKEVLAGQGNDYVMGGDGSDQIHGNEGDDWLEGGGANNLLLGDNGDLVQGLPIKTSVVSTILGHDVLLSGGGNEDFDAENGDDIMVAGAGTDRFFGQTGFDWVSHKDITAGVEIDMGLRQFAPPSVPASPSAILDRYAQVEAVSGSKFSDIIRGDDANANPVEEALKAGNVALITGLAAILGTTPEALAALPADQVVFDSGNILLGGAGSDVIEGRGGNDIIDGNAWLNVRIGIMQNGVEVATADRMQGLVTVNAGFEAQYGAWDGRKLDTMLFDRTVTGSDLKIVREILTASVQRNSTGQIVEADTALFGDIRANYIVEFDGANIIVTHDPDGDGTVADGVIGGEGIKVLRGIERLKFADGVVEQYNTTNNLASGTPIATQTGTLATGDVVFTVDVDSLATTIVDGDGIAANATYQIKWQVELVAGSGIFSDILTDLQGEVVPVMGPTFTPTPAENGLLIRAAITFLDTTGAIETVYSIPQTTANDAPVALAQPVLLAATVTEDTAQTFAFADLLADVVDPDGDPLTVTSVTVPAEVGTISNVDAIGFTFTPAPNVSGPVDFTFLVSDGFNPPVSLVASTVITAIDDPTLGTVTVTATPSGAGGAMLTAVSTVTDADGIASIVHSWSTGATADTLVVGNATNLNVARTLMTTVTDSLGNETVFTNSVNVRSGTAAANAGANVQGSTTADVISGLAGADNINGAGGNDTILGGTGADVIAGGTGSDTIIWTAAADGRDIINGDVAADNDATAVDTFVINGNAQNETFRIYTRAEAITRGVATNAQLQAGTEIVVTRAVGLGAPAIIAELNNIEEIVLNGGAFNNTATPTLTPGSDTVQIFGDFTGILSPNTIYLQALGTDPVIDLTGRQSDHRVVIEVAPGVQTLTINGPFTARDVIQMPEGSAPLVKFVDGDTATMSNGDITITMAANSAPTVENCEVKDGETGGDNGSGGDDGYGEDNESEGGEDEYEDENEDEEDEEDEGYGEDEGYESEHGTSYDDDIVGGRKDDALYGKDGDDDVYGGRGDDKIYGGKGDDCLAGGRGDDKLYGGKGDDCLDGGRGDDTLDGGKGNDEYYVCSGDDVVVLKAGFGHDVVKGFDAKGCSSDKIDVSAYGFECKQEFYDAVEIEQDGRDTVIKIGDDCIELENVKARDISHHDFIL